MEKIEVYFDGACEPVNPGGIATYGFVVYRNHEKIHEDSGVAGAGCLGDDTSNNMAEYTALIKALEWLIESKLTETKIVVKGDSQLVIKQLNKQYAVKAPRIIPLYLKAQKLASMFKDISFIWIPREQNKEADTLSHKAYLDFCNKHKDFIKNTTREKQQALN